MGTARKWPSATTAPAFRKPSASACSTRSTAVREPRKSPARGWGSRLCGRSRGGTEATRAARRRAGGVAASSWFCRSTAAILDKGIRMRTKTIGATYLMIGVVLALFLAVLVAVVRATPVPVVEGAALIQPVVALVVLTAIVALTMAVYRNVALIRGAASARYFRTYTADSPAEWVERPAR